MKLLQKISVLGLAACSMFIAQAAQAQTASVLLAEETSFKVFPNPSQDEDTFVSLLGFKAHDLLVVVYDLLGREIYSKVEVREEEGFLFSISSEGKKLPSGIYQITASANDKVFRQKLIVK